VWPIDAELLVYSYPRQVKDRMAITRKVDIASIRERVKNRAEMMTPQLLKAAEILLSRPEDVALLSMRELAARCKMQPSTFVRLARALDFNGYPELQHVFAENLRRTSGDYSPRAEQLQRGDGEDKKVSLIKGLFANKIRNIEWTFERNKPQLLIDVAELLHKAERAFLVGQRSSYPVTFFLHYVFQLFSSKSILVQDAGGTFADDLRGIGPQDALFVISMRPYTRNSVLAAEYAAEHGCPVIAVTDNELSPLCRAAKFTIFADATAPSFFDSIVAPLTIIEALLGLMMIEGGKKALANVKISEEQLSKFGAYWKDNASK
jgi:DNA-binding MurR/RpiR family transcriptional regulator